MNIVGRKTKVKAREEKARIENMKNEQNMKMHIIQLRSMDLIDGKT